MGSRLWPASRQSPPKPFLVVENGQSLLLNTFARAASFDDVTDIVTITALESSFNTVAEYDKHPGRVIKNHLLLEPMPRDTAAATAAATFYVADNFGPDVTMLFLTADHMIKDLEGFRRAVTHAAAKAAEGQIVTFGIEPVGPETGYGYIEVDGERAVQFHEKPDEETAQRYCDAGNFLWNSGMFRFAAGTLLKAMRQQCPQILESSQKAVQNGLKRSVSEHQLENELDADAFVGVEKISIDFAVMEKVDNLSVVRADIGWSDVGTWSSLSEIYAADDDGNTTIGDTALIRSKNCFVRSEDRLIGVVGLDNVAVVDTRDATLVVDKSRSQDVRKLFEHLRDVGHEAPASFPTGYRPWGSYTILDEGAGYKVKRIEVKPGGCLSLQSHKHRSEHWTVVDGIAHVVNGGEDFMLKANESIYIECGNRHRLENRGPEPMTLIEVQTGAYLGEDDITRYEDIYGRS